MKTQCERRRKDRVRFSWPLWFSYKDNDELFRGQVVDLCGSYVSFTVEEQFCPPPGRHLMTRFSFPLNSEKTFELGKYMHWAEVVRVDSSLTPLRRVAMRLHQPIKEIEKEIQAIAT